MLHLPGVLLPFTYCHATLQECNYCGHDCLPFHVGMESAECSSGATDREERGTDSSCLALSSMSFNLHRQQLILEERKGEARLCSSSTHSLPTARQSMEDYLARTLHAASRSRMAFRFLIQDNLKQTYLCVSEL